MTARDEVKEIMEHELKSTDRMVDLLENNPDGEVASGCLSLTKDLIDNVESEMKAKVILETAGNIGRATQDEELIEYSVKAIQSIENDGRE